MEFGPLSYSITPVRAGEALYREERMERKRDASDNNRMYAQTKDKQYNTNEEARGGKCVKANNQISTFCPQH